MKQLIAVVAFTALTTMNVSPAAEPLTIARQGNLFAGGKYSTINGQQVMSGQLYAEYQIPARQTHPYPIVMIHGGRATGSYFSGTPDGREGWAQYFLRQGYAVYVVDLPGYGRAAYVPELYGRSERGQRGPLTERYTATERYKLWPQAHLHTQWPGAGMPGDPIYDQFAAAEIPQMTDVSLQQTSSRDALIELLETIGPAILMTHSRSPSLGWPVADARSNLVKAILAIEPLPPFYDVVYTPGSPSWYRDEQTSARRAGISYVPLSYSPPLPSGSELTPVQEGKADGADLVRCWLQKAPARQLPNLQKMPILILIGEASFTAPFAHCTAKYLEQAGVHPSFIRLSDRGIHGNGHYMMVEKNSLEVAAVISRWLEKEAPRAAGNQGSDGARRP